MGECEGPARNDKTCFALRVMLKQIRMAGSPVAYLKEVGSLKRVLTLLTVSS